MRQVLLVLGFMAFLPAAPAAEFRALDVSRDGDRYEVKALVYLDAPPAAVYAVLTDYDHLTRISGSIVASRRVQQLDVATALVYTDTRLCALFFCRHIRELQKLVGTPPSDISSEVLPQQSDNVRAGNAALHLEAEGSGTLMRWDLNFEPGFWVPPLIGPALVERGMRNEGRRSAAGVEKLARERAHLPALRTEEHEKVRQ